MKKYKRWALIIFTMFIIPTLSLNVSATSSTPVMGDVSQEKYGEIIEYFDNEDPKPLTDESYEEPKNRVFISEETIHSQNDNEMIQPYSYGWSEKSTVKKTEYHVKTTTPTGQLPGGTRFGTSNGGFYVNKNGGPKQGFSIGTSWGPVSFSIPIGSASSTNIGGKFIGVANTTNYFRAKIDFTIRYRRVLVDRYQYGQYKNSYWTTWKDIYRDRIYTVKVK